MNAQNSIKFSRLMATMLFIFNCSVVAGIVDSFDPPKKSETTNKEDEEEGWFTLKQGKNVLYAASVITGAATVGALTGGGGALLLAKAGLASIPTSTGAIAGGIAGASYGTDVAVEEFGSDKPSSSSQIASEIGKGALFVLAGSAALGVPVYVAPKDALSGLSYAARWGWLSGGYTAAKIVRKIFKDEK